MDNKSLSKPFDRELSVGVYDATDNFKSIDRHSCVCYADTLGLVAVTGPAGDKESEKYADLFAEAPNLLEALEEAVIVLADVKAKMPAHDAAYQSVTAAHRDGRALVRKIKYGIEE